MKHTIQVYINGEGWVLREVEATPIKVLDNGYEYMLYRTVNYRDETEDTWTIGEVSCGCGITQGHKTKTKALAAAIERIEKDVPLFHKCVAECKERFEELKKAVACA